MVRLLKIRGDSLWPDFSEGDYVLALGVPVPVRKIKAGDVIVFHQPGYGTLIKRVKRVLGDGQAFEVRGTQVYSTDSRNFGSVLREHVSGKIIWHIRRKNP